MRHVPRGELIRRRLAADRVMRIRTRRDRRAGTSLLDALREFKSWLSRYRFGSALPPLLRRYAATWLERWVREQRLRNLRRHPGCPQVRIRWVQPGPRGPDAHDMWVPWLMRPPRRPIERVRRRAALAKQRRQVDAARGL